jgi:hypothetical protein
VSARVQKRSVSKNDVTQKIADSLVITRVDYYVFPVVAHRQLSLSASTRKNAAPRTDYFICYDNASDEGVIWKNLPSHDNMVCECARAM